MATGARCIRVVGRRGFVVVEGLAMFRVVFGLY